MIPFKEVFTPVFFITLGYFLIAVVGLVFAAQFRRSRGGRLSLILLLAMVAFTAYNCIQWLMNGFIPYFVSNYATAHTSWQLPAWVNWVLEYVYLYGLNAAIAVLFSLTAWAALKEARSRDAVESLNVDAQGQERNPGDAETEESSNVPGGSATPAPDGESPSDSAPEA